MWIVESSIPIAMILLSRGWNARKVDAGGGGMKVVMTWIRHSCVAMINISGESAFATISKSTVSVP